jgi:hypothetical protein
MMCTRSALALTFSKMLQLYSNENEINRQAICNGNNSDSICFVITMIARYN